MVGSFNSTTDFDGSALSNTISPTSARNSYLLVLTSTGLFQYAVIFEGTGVNAASSVCQTPTGDLLVGGNFQNSVDLDPSVAVSSFSSAGVYDVFMVKLSECLDVPATSCPLEICSGQSAQLTATAQGALSWFNSAASTISIASGSVLGMNNLAPGVYTVFVASSNCSLSRNRAPSIVQVNALPAVQVSPASATLCTGSVLSLSASGADTFTWSNGSNTSAITLSPPVSTLITLSGSSTLTGCSNTDSTQVQVFITPVLTLQAQPPIICVGEVITLSASGAISYSWSTSAQSSTLQVAPASSGSYSVAGTTGPCTGTATAMISVEPCTGLDTPNNSSGLSVFPNPFSEVLMVSSESSLEVCLMDALGQLLLTRSMNGREYLTLSQFENGMYTMLVRTEGETKAIRLVKQSP